MSEDRQLKGKIARLAEPASGPLHRRLAGPDAAGLVAAIVAEIDLTVLGRALDFENARGEVLGLDVAGRRLLRVRAAPSGPVAEGFADFLGKPLSGADAAAMEALHALLAGFARGGDALQVTARRLATPPDGADIGCHARTLSEIWALPEAPAAGTPDPEALSAAEGAGIAGFVEVCAGRASAWLVTDRGEATGHSAPSAATTRLLQLLHSETPPAGFDGGAATACAVIGEPGTPDVLFRGRLGDEGVLLLYPASALQELLTHWRAATR